MVWRMVILEGIDASQKRKPSLLFLVSWTDWILLGNLVFRRPTAMFGNYSAFEANPSVAPDGCKIHAFISLDDPASKSSSLLTSGTIAFSSRLSPPAPTFKCSLTVSWAWKRLASEWVSERLLDHKLESCRGRRPIENAESYGLSREST